MEVLSDISPVYVKGKDREWFSWEFQSVVFPISLSRLYNRLEELKAYECRVESSLSGEVSRRPEGFVQGLELIREFEACLYEQEKGVKETRELLRSYEILKISKGLRILDLNNDLKRLSSVKSLLLSVKFINDCLKLVVAYKADASVATETVALILQIASSYLRRGDNRLSNLNVHVSLAGNIQDEVVDLRQRLNAQLAENVFGCIKHGKYNALLDNMKVYFCCLKAYSVLPSTASFGAELTRQLCDLVIHGVSSNFLTYLSRSLVILNVHEFLCVIHKNWKCCASGFFHLNKFRKIFEGEDVVLSSLENVLEEITWFYTKYKDLIHHEFVKKVKGEIEKGFKSIVNCIFEYIELAIKQWDFENSSNTDLNIIINKTQTLFFRINHSSFISDIMDPQIAERLKNQIIYSKLNEYFLYRHSENLTTLKELLAEDTWGRLDNNNIMLPRQKRNNVNDSDSEIILCVEDLVFASTSMERSFEDESYDHVRNDHNKCTKNLNEQFLKLAKVIGCIPSPVVVHDKMIRKKEERTEQVSLKSKDNSYYHINVSTISTNFITEVLSQYMLYMDIVNPNLIWEACVELYKLAIYSVIGMFSTDDCFSLFLLAPIEPKDTTSRNNDLYIINNNNNSNNNNNNNNNYSYNNNNNNDSQINDCDDNNNVMITISDEGYDDITPPPSLLSCFNMTLKTQKRAAFYQSLAPHLREVVLEIAKKQNQTVSIQKYNFCPGSLHGCLQIVTSIGALFGVYQFLQNNVFSELGEQLDKTLIEQNSILEKPLQECKEILYMQLSYKLINFDKLLAPDILTCESLSDDLRRPIAYFSSHLASLKSLLQSLGGGAIPSSTQKDVFSTTRHSLFLLIQFATSYLSNKLTIPPQNIHQRFQPLISVIDETIRAYDD